MKRRLPAVACLMLSVLVSPGIFAQTQWKVANTFHVGGDGGWDYVEADSDARRLYVSHDTEIVVLDLRKQERARWRSIEGRATSMLRGQNLGRNRRPVLKTRGGELQ